MDKSTIIGRFHISDFHRADFNSVNSIPTYERRPCEEIRKERVRRRAEEIFQDYLSRLDLLEELKNKGYRILNDEGFQSSNHDTVANS